MIKTATIGKILHNANWMGTLQVQLDLYFDVEVVRCRLLSLSLNAIILSFHKLLLSSFAIDHNFVLTL